MSDLEEPLVEGPSSYDLNQQLKLNEQYYGRSKKQPRTWHPTGFPKQELPEHIKRDPFLWRIFKRLHYEDKNVLMLVVGETGAGKSDFAINICNKIDITPLGDGKYRNNFIVQCDPRGKPTLNTRVVFSASDFMRLVRSNLPKGSCIVWDEAGIENDNTKWYEKKSKLVKYVMQTFRKNNFLLVMTVPDQESVTVATRRLVHVIADVFERTDEHASVDIRWLQRNRSNKKTYPKHTAYYDEETGMISKLAVYLIEPLAPVIRRPYDKIKDYILEDLYAFVEREMREMDQIERTIPDDGKDLNETPMKKFDIIKGLEIIQNNIEQVQDDKGNVSTSKIILLLGKKGYRCAIQNARTIKDNLEY